MEVINLKAQLREQTGRKVKGLREEDLIPAVVYGHDFPNQNIAIEYVPFSKAYEKAGESTLVDLKIGEKDPIKVLVQDIQRHPLKDNFIHVDFKQVSMTEKLEADIPLNFVGESKAVKEMNGILVKNLDTLSVKCLPGALVYQIDVNLEALENFESVIRVGDIKLPEGMELIGEVEDAVASVEEPRSEEELAATDAPVEENVESVEVEGKKKEEESSSEKEETPAEE